MQGREWALPFTYDAASNRTLRTDSQSGVSTLTYDLLNRMTTYQYNVSGVLVAFKFILRIEVIVP
jgi:YD repeat-containing protein